MQCSTPFAVRSTRGWACHVAQPRRAGRPSPTGWSRRGLPHFPCASRSRSTRVSTSRSSASSGATSPWTRDGSRAVHRFRPTRSTSSWGRSSARSTSGERGAISSTCGSRRDGLRSIPSGSSRASCEYLGHAGLTVSRAEFEANLEAKTADPRFLDDIAPLLSPRCPWDPADATRYVREELLARLPGDPWRGGGGGGEAPR